MSTIKILAFAGSARSDSFNKKLVKISGAGARAAGADVTDLDFRDLPLPLFDEDLERAEGLPDNAVKLKAMLKEHHGFLIACPEYNSSITPLLKNAIDWASRPEPSEPPLACFNGKIAVLMSASPGRLGGLRGLAHVRSILCNIGVLVLPDQKAIGSAHQAFDANGNLHDESQQEAIMKLGARVTSVSLRLNT
ncbi:NAD(P)H-dependent oxidoreductase [Synechococcus sp. BA-124 BA4]|jgi:chromate reductase, NAD(P)H dehydrogenase (quinone)|uniref:NADPH-dependent FMN reductase n=1 Tax=unclassified Synechococcus TaxID=2626047 RepID=UPI0018CC926C|nr:MULTISPECIES: NAD(P)H-dependent oxidoreductase [unclassified Synechococcus]MEA5399065.1 NAD(P)H-dependent oxidoreductase [Synechococcus sp. BA-124 BA4]QPN55998.1 NAD(P)H-dependent oxidoreductase [Synechococcus sp. CBW1107]CAK6699944.1 NAD(P)H-dependent FMN reductase [Synechococcus sp. CBW1107]